eukprot:CAMPEP_0202874552 /NCGR_PEP_ID=MMETSP1391-20130828/25613_1 /ASSEMBLY_ACC=CAM_ASM_000867 /TAXON_ID=1034604 /ORGANISM="Chlamydomonas leiostraca, Strain SAG 11-49" /LENGTH=259 /DNA_ID=CAMNT_0049556007 /DNA_START=39 /DNA_END=815 /DNA_ORIENTATION=+
MLTARSMTKLLRAASFSAPHVRLLKIQRQQCRALTARQRLQVKASASGGDAGTGGAGGAGPGPGSNPNPNNEGPQAISLISRLPGPGTTFVLAGFLKILTIGAVASTAPQDTLRTAIGKMSPYLMVPVGLVMCWVAKFIVDNELQESRKFMAGLVAVLVFLYFGLYKLLYRWDPRAELPRGTTAVMASSPVARARAWAGDRELGSPIPGGVTMRDSRAYVKEQGSTKYVDDLAYYEGQYASDMARGDRQPGGATSTAEL